ncbi:unnamed protein product [Camellia sinensis]
MEASIFPAVFVSPSSATTTTMTVVHGGGRVTDHSKPVINLISRNRNNRSIKTHRFKTPTTAAAAINDVLAAADPDQVAVSWQIVVGALAGVTPFVVAGIEFSKRIVAQRKCGVCGGSGLVLRDKYYFRCPGCVWISPLAIMETILFWLESFVFSFSFFSKPGIVMKLKPLPRENQNKETTRLVEEVELVIQHWNFRAQRRVQPISS